MYIRQTTKIGAAAAFIVLAMPFAARAQTQSPEENEDILTAFMRDFFAARKDEGDARQEDEKDRQIQSDRGAKNKKESSNASTTSATTTIPKIDKPAAGTSTPVTAPPLSPRVEDPAPITTTPSLPVTGGNVTPPTIIAPRADTATTTTAGTVPVGPRGVNPLTYVKSGAFVGPGASLYSRTVLDPDIARLLALLGAIATATGFVLIREHVRLPRSFGRMPAERPGKLFSHNLK